MNFQNVEFLISAASKENFPTKRLPEIAFAGKSNVGKSSVINRLLQRKNFARVGDKPGKTVHVNYFTLDGACYLVDLPGYGFAKVSAGEKERWGRLMEDYFAANRIDLGVLIVDYRHPPTNNDITMARWFLDSGCPFVVVANKMDKLKKSEMAACKEEFEKICAPYGCRAVVLTSAENGLGCDELRALLEASMAGE